MKKVGERIKSARGQLGYSRKKFAEKYNFSAATLQAWEDGRYVVPFKAIVRYIHALEQAGLESSVEWFMHGSGTSPRPKQQLIKEALVNNHTNTFPINNKQDPSFFEQTDKNSILVSISDDAMTPFFAPGDFVGGYFISKDTIDQYIGSFCIVIIASREILVRKLKYGTNPDCFTLVSTNLDSEVETAFLTNCTINKIAPITWHRKAFNDADIK